MRNFMSHKKDVAFRQKAIQEIVKKIAISDLKAAS